MTTTAPEATLEVGWIGLGSQGGPMARALVNSGISVQLWARRAEALEEYADTPATTSATSADLIKDKDVVVLVVRDDDDVRALLLGAAQSEAGGSRAAPPIAAMKKGAVIVIHSTVHPDTVREIEKVAAGYGVGVVDAPVSGGGHAAEDKSLLVMTAGDPDAVAKVQPILSRYSNLTPYLGPAGAAQNAKIINNYLLTANMGVAQSAFAIAKQVGVDPESLKLVLAHGSGRSFGVNLVGGDDWDLKPSSTTAGPLLQKDTRLMVALAASAGAEMGVSLAAAESALNNMGLEL